MGISIRLYRLGKAENIQQIYDLETALQKALHTVVDLYKMTQDLGIVFLNSVHAYTEPTAIGNKILFGNSIEEQAGDRMCGGFIPSSEVAGIVQWIRERNLQNFRGFSDLYDDLSEEALTELENIGSPGKEELYNGYVKQLVKLYELALEQGNSIVICGE